MLGTPDTLWTLSYDTAVILTDALAVMAASGRAPHPQRCPRALLRIQL